MTDKATPEMKEVLNQAVEDYFLAFNSKKYMDALKAADTIRNIGLQLGSDAWNTEIGT